METTWMPVGRRWLNKLWNCCYTTIEKEAYSDVDTWYRVTSERHCWVKKQGAGQGVEHVTVCVFLKRVKESTHHQTHLILNSWSTSGSSNEDCLWEGELGGWKQNEEERLFIVYLHALWYKHWREKVHWFRFIDFVIRKY